MVRLDLRGVSTRCAKKGCIHTGVPLHRHHRRSEKFFINTFVERKRDPIYQAFVRRYYEFRPLDIVSLCPPHHREIHQLYHFEYSMQRMALGDAARWTWKQANTMMDRFEEVCAAWLLQVSPGAAEWPEQRRFKQRRRR